MSEQAETFFSTAYSQGGKMYFNNGPTKLRANAPDTSRAAAVRALPKSGSARTKVYETILTSGGLTDEQIVVLTGLSPNSARPRRKELQEAGLIFDSGQRRNTATGSKAIVWMATPPGDAA